MNKSLRKLFSLALALALVFSSGLGVGTLDVQAAEAKTFTDVKADHEFYKFVTYLVEKNITTGYTEGEKADTFGVNETLTRRHAAMFLVRALGAELPTYTGVFADVKEGSSGAQHVEAAAALGLVKGYKNADGTSDFRPEEPVKRSQFAKMVTEAYGLKEDPSKTLKVTDLKGNTELAYIKAVLDNGVVNGYPDNTYRPNNPVTRGHVSKFIYNAEHLVPEKLEVVSVNAINATQIEVKLSKAMTKADLFANATALPFKGAANITVTPVASPVAETLSAVTLSEDGKTITLNKAAAFTAGRYVVVVNGFEVDGEKITKYDDIITIKEDKTAPVITGTKTISATVAEVTFSEPLSAMGTISYKYADGTAVASGDVSHAFNADQKSIIFTMNTNATVGKAIVATIIGAQDKNNNLLNPNPATVTFTKGAKDGVKPTVVSVTQTGVKKLEVKLSEELQVNPTFNIGGASAAKVVKDSVDKTKYEVTAAAILDGATTVAISGMIDLSGEIGDAYSKVYNFTKTDVTSSVISTEVYKDSATGKEYLQITFDNNVEFATPTVDVTGTRVKDNVTTTLSGTTPVAPTYKDPLNKKVILVDLATLLTGGMDTEGAVYNTTLIFTNVTSESGKAVVNTFKSNFTRGKNSTVVTAVPTVTTAVQSATDNNVITVTFDMNVDLATATDASNYLVSGAVVSSAIATSGTTKTIDLTLQEGSNIFTGVRNVTVKNVKALNGTKAMTTKTIVSGVIKENVRPTFTASLIDVNTIKVEFSEAIAHSTIATALNKVNFEVKVDGVANIVSAVNSDTLATPTVAAADTGYKTVYLKLTTAITDVSKPITLSATSIQDVTKTGAIISTDEIGNPVSSAVVNVTK